MPFITPSAAVFSGNKGEASFFSLLKDGKQIYGINTTGTKMVLGLGKDKGVSGIYIPEGEDPVCLTEGITQTDLQECQGLRTAIVKGALKIITEDAAREYYDTHVGRAEIVKEKIRRLQERARLDPIAPTGQKAAEIAPRILGIVAEINSNALPEEVALTELEAKQNTYTVADLSHLRNSVRNRTIQLWAEDILQKMDTERMAKAQENVPEDLKDVIGRPGK